MNYFSQTLEKLTQDIPDLQLSSDQPSQQRNYYAGDVRLQVFKCLYQGKNSLLKIYDEPHRKNYEIQYAQYTPEILPNNIKMAQVFLGQSEDTESTARGWYIMEELNLPEQHISMNEYLQLYPEYLQSISQHEFNTNPPSILPTPKDAATWVTQKVTHWYQLPNQTQNFSEAEKQQIESELEQILQKYLPLLQNYFNNKILQITHGQFRPEKIFKSQEPESENQYFLTDYGHLSYQYHGYDLSLAVWAEAIMKNIQSKSYQNIPTQVFNLIETINSEQIFQNPSHIIYCMIERSLGTLFADIWAANQDESKQDKLNKHTAILNLLEQLNSKLEN